MWVGWRNITVEYISGKTGQIRPDSRHKFDRLYQEHSAHFRSSSSWSLCPIQESDYWKNWSQFTNYARIIYLLNLGVEIFVSTRNIILSLNRSQMVDKAVLTSSKERNRQNQNSSLPPGFGLSTAQCFTFVCAFQQRKNVLISWRLQSVRMQTLHSIMPIVGAISPHILIMSLWEFNCWSRVGTRYITEDTVSMIVPPKSISSVPAKISLGERK